MGNFPINPYKKQLEKQEAMQRQVKQDKVEISPEAKELQAENKVIADRNEKVAALKQQVQAGDYKIDANKTATKIVDFFNK